MLEGWFVRIVVLLNVSTITWVMGVLHYWLAHEKIRNMFALNNEIWYKYIYFIYTLSQIITVFFFCFQTMKRIASGSPIFLFPVNIPTQNFEMKKKRKPNLCTPIKKAIQSLARFVFVCRNQSVCCCRRKWNCEFCLSSGGGSTSIGSMSSIRCAISSKDIGMLHFSTFWASEQWHHCGFRLSVRKSTAYSHLSTELLNIPWIII